MTPRDQVLPQEQKPDVEKQLEPSWEDKPPAWHAPAINGVGPAGVHQRLEKAGLKASTEALIMAAGEQALGTRATEVGI